MISKNKDSEEKLKETETKRKSNPETGKRSNRGEKTIRISFEETAVPYSELVEDVSKFRSYLENYFKQYPELFPIGFEGFTFHDKHKIKKLDGLIVRRIKLVNGEIYEIVPSYVMPYMSGYTEDVWKGLLLRCWAVPYEVIAKLFGRDSMYWMRLESSLGRSSIVGSLCKNGIVPEHLVADEKISHWNGHECYIAMTSSKDCVLGAELSMKENTEGLEEAYGVFKSEAIDCQSNYNPKSINLDGWKATNLSWSNLFPKMTIILCYLHAFLKIRDIAKSLKEQYFEICTQVWDVYRKKEKNDFIKALKELEEWAVINFLIIVKLLKR